MPLDWRTNLIHSQAAVPEGFQSLATPTYRGSTTSFGSAMVLQNNGADDLTITGNGPVKFPGKLQSGSAHNVTILYSRPSPN